MPKIADFYRKLGWTTIPMTVFHGSLLPVATLKATESAALDGSLVVNQVVSAPSETDLLQLETLHGKIIAQTNGCFTRSREYWLRWLFQGEWTSANRTSLWVVRNSESKQIQAYLVARSRPLSGLMAL